MALGKGTGFALLASVMLLQACASSEDGPGLMNLRSQSEGPDEFAIVPNKPLQMPSNLSALPEPQPGGPNLVDLTPLDDAVIALGGRPGAGSGDQALVSAASRYGVSASIRQDLAEEDAAFRSTQRPKLLERLFGKSTYHSAYSRQTTRPDAELDRWRAAGARTPSVPPVSDRK